jgi:hypothetical protein
MVQLPKGIERDDTVHGKLYYTRAQMIHYAKQCVEKALNGELDEPPTKTDSKVDSKVEELMNIFGMKK